MDSSTLRMAPLLHRAGVMRRVAALVLVTMAATIAGCGSMRRPGFPRQSYDEDRQIKQLEAVFEKPDAITDFYDPTKTPEAARRDARDRIVTGRLVLIDLNYNEFVRQFASNKQGIDTATDITLTGLNLATTAVGGAEAKTVLAAIATGVSASKLAVDKNYFYEKTVPVLITAMNAQRRVVLLQIMKGLALPPNQYTLAQGLSDLDAYYFAGTFLGALQAIQADAGAKDKTAEIEIKEIRDVQFFDEVRQGHVRALQDTVDQMSKAQAIALAKNPPVRSAASDKLVAAMDPGGKSLTDEAAAKRILKVRLIYDRSDEALKAWDAAIHASE